MLILLLFFAVVSTEAKDLGVFGETFEIAERDLLEQIFSRLRELEKTGVWESEKIKVESRIKEMILHPQPIVGITHTQKTKEYKFDPTITVTRDLSDHKGQVFVKKGERFNPLNKIGLSKPLLFIDGGAGKHIKWAISKLKDATIHGHESGKIVLVNGSPFDLQNQLDRAVYFDQHGILTTKLGIRHIPAIVFQKQGAKLLTIIEETVGVTE
ncbi:MAG: type-F conjugative transfer system protein TraW [Holosporaceae bacterium]|jgi:conjugal transfer pilus assembly protein TraW|nr:type-F conjugative transfer system protein TraW [Holosporaceae bacterium]